MAALVLACLVPIPGCSDTHVLSGSYRSAGTVSVSVVPQLQNVPFTIEMILGHYGPDVAGIVRFSGDALPKDFCHCRLLRDGAFSDSDVFTFKFPAPWSCSKDEPEAVGKLQMYAHGTTLEGTIEFKVLKDDKTEQSEPIPVTMARLKEAEALKESDRLCPEDGVDLINPGS
jgi:hypothetical protein